MENDYEMCASKYGMDKVVVSDAHQRILNFLYEIDECIFTLEVVRGKIEKNVMIAEHQSK